MRYEIRILNTNEEILAITESWEHCRQQQIHPSLAQHPDWLISEMNSPGATGIMAVVLYDSGKIVGVAPLVIRQQELCCSPNYKTICRFKLHFGNYCGYSLLAPENEEANKVLLSGIADACAVLDVISFEHIPVDSLLWKLLKDSRQLFKSRRVYSSDAEIHRLIHLTGAFDEYLSKFDGQRRRKLKYALKKLEGACNGKLHLDQVTKRDQIRSFLKQVEQVSARSWQGRLVGQVFYSTDSEFERLGIQADHGWLRCYLLRCDKEPLAFVMGRQSSGVYYYDQVGFDPAWQDYSPGKTLLYLIIQDLYATDKPEWLDFKHGDTEYKRFFSTDNYYEECIYLVRKTFYASFAFFIYNIYQKAIKLTKACVKRLGLMEIIRRLRSRLRRTQ